jgi:hypothetical protein
MSLRHRVTNCRDLRLRIGTAGSCRTRIVVTAVNGHQIRNSADDVELAVEINT